MTSDPFVLGLVLFSALMHAAWNTVIKTGGDGLLMFAVVKAPTMVIAVLVLAVVGPPSYSMDSSVYPSSATTSIA